MATLLMVESWLRSTGHSLPPLIRRLGHDYVLLTKDPALYPESTSGLRHPVRANASEIVRADTNDPDAAVAAARTVASRRRIDGVLTTCDYYLPTVATIADALSLPGARPDVLHTATRKHRVRQALDDAGVPNVGFAVADSYDAARDAAMSLGYPLVAKPVDLNSGTAVQRVDDDAALKDAFHEITADERNTRGQPRERVMLLEQLVDGTEVSVEAITRDGETTIVGITDKSLAGPPAFVESGHMFPAELPESAVAETSAYVRDVLAALDYRHGLSHTELRLTTDGPRLIEVNPRQAGGYIFDLLHLVTGVHPLEQLVRLSLGQQPRAHETTDIASAAVFFVISPRPGTVVGVVGTGALDVDPDVVRWQLSVPARAGLPRSNDAYLGHVVVSSASPCDARAKAEAAVGSLRLRFADGTHAQPLGVPSVVSPAPVGS
ncbi:ATP-grasp domain-containing protein [Haloechinothrix salitolerans]|uniref:ATP-grasp domain-containing protein n=1 Tax=Haloechinothrix salitolerans TaxID=926830 RepID=A0ABW2C8Q8_9PSEU